jgi:phage terminase large subunit
MTGLSKNERRDPMSQLILPAPSAKQAQFLTDTHRVLAYGGARGGGKSWAVRVKAVLLCLRYAGIKVLIVRKTYPELQENHVLPLCQLLRVYDPDPRERLAEYNDQKKTLRFPNGSRILFRPCDDDRDALRFQGLEVDVLFVDEATQQPEERMQRLRSCVRGVNGFPKRLCFTCNPGGPGHGWVKRLFIDRRFRDTEDPRDYAFIRSLDTDLEDHVADETRYLCMSRPVRPLREAPAKAILSDPLDMLGDRR